MNPKIPAAALALLLVATAFAEEAKGKVTFLSPADGTVVKLGDKVTVSYEADLGPKGNHLHLYLDDRRMEVLRQTKGTADILMQLPGTHEICLEIETSWHFSTGVRQCVNVNVNMK